MKITEMAFYGGARSKITHLALTELFLEVQEVILGTRINLAEEEKANGAAYIRQALDDSFNEVGGWTKITTGGIDWKKRYRFNTTLVVTIGVEVQVSSRSDMVVRDIVHLRNSIQDGEIEVGIIVVPSDYMQKFIPDRTPSYKETIRYIEEEFPEAKTFPLIIIAIEHDGVGEKLPKQKRKS
jgi:hypothetical protein